MKYTFRAAEELTWAVLIAVALVVLPALVTLDPAAVTDWHVWLVALGGASVRAAAGAALDWLRRRTADEEEAPAAAPELVIPPGLVTALADELERRREERVRRVREAAAMAVPHG